MYKQEYHLIYSAGRIVRWSQESFDNLPVEKLQDLKYYKEEKYGKKYRYSEADYNYNSKHKETFEKYFKGID